MRGYVAFIAHRGKTGMAKAKKADAEADAPSGQDFDRALTGRGRRYNIRPRQVLGLFLRGGHQALELADGVRFDLAHTLGGDTIFIRQLVQGRLVVRHPTAL